MLSKTKSVAAYKVGQIFYQVMITDDGCPAVEEWHVRTIRGGYVHAIWKLNRTTWGKRSSKHGDFGWLARIPKWCRKKWKLDPAAVYSFDRIPDDFKTTKLAAIRHEIKSLDPLDYDDPAAFERAGKALKSMATRARGKKK